MATSPNATQITPPRVPIIDQRTGAVSREWYRWFYSLYNIVGGNLGVIPVSSGGTGLSTIPTNGQLLIGNGTGYSLNTLAVGAGISVVNGVGTITLANTGVLSNIAGNGISVSNATGNVTITNTGVLSFAGGTTGLTPAAAATGDITLAGTLGIANGGTNGSATPIAGAVAYGTGTAYAFTAAGTAGQVLTSNGASAPTWSTAASGSVTSVSFTGGIITVATPTTTPAFTVAGTSGGIPYFSSGTTWASSAALTQYGVVYGGGAGAAPVSTAAGTTGQVLTATTGGAPTWAAPATSGTVTSVSVTSANGFAGTVATATSTPAISISTSITGLIFGNGTAIAAATISTPLNYSTGTLSLAASYGDTQNPYASKTANYVLAAPNGSAGVPTFRALVAADVPGSALTKTDDTNVTLTLGGSASTALLNAASLTLGWTGQLATTRGGTGLSSFTANGIVYASSTSALATGSTLTYDGNSVINSSAGSGANSYGFNVSSSLTGATNNYAFYGGIAAATGRWNFYAFGDASNYMAGALGIGSTALTARRLVVGGSMTGATGAYGVLVSPTIQPDVTVNALVTASQAATAANGGTPYTIAALACFNAAQGTFNADSTVTNQYGFVATASLTGATNNYGFYSNIATAANRYNFYANGTAPNRFSGDVQIFGAGGLGYTTGSGGTVTQGTSRTTGVTLNKTNGAITMFTAAGSMIAATFTVTNSTVAATDTIILNQKSGTNLYVLLVTAVAAGSFNITFYTTGGVASDAPVINFSVIKAVTA